VSDDRDHQGRDRRRFRIAGTGERSSVSTLGPMGHVDDLVAAYALGALEPEESASVDAHVRACVACEHALVDAQSVAGMLSFTAPSRVPPVHTKAALFARVAQTQQAAAAVSLPTQSLDIWRTPTIPASVALDVMPRVPAAAPSGVVTSAKRGNHWLVSFLSLPLLVALVATGFWGLQLRDRLTSQDSQLAELQAQLTNFASGTTSYQLSPGYAAPQAEGKVVMGADQRAGRVQIDVNTDEGAKDFEMWVNDDGNLKPLTEISVDQQGRGQASFQLDQPFADYDGVYIKAKPVDPTAEATGLDTLVRDNAGGLGSTGSSLDVGP
jgi:hypothetical protein